MRALYIPFPVITNIWRDGKFLAVWDHVEELVDHHGYHCYILLQSLFRPDYEKRFPEGRRGVTMVWDDTFLKYPNRDRHKMLDSRFLVEQFSRRYGYYQIDWVWVTEPGVAPALKALLSDTSKRDLTVKAIPLFVADTGTMEPTTWYNSLIPLLDQPDSLYRSLGFLSGYPVFHSEVKRQRQAEEYEKWLSPYAIKEIKKQTLLLPTLLNVRSLDQVAVEKAEKFTVIYGGRISSDKNFKQVGAILRAAQGLGGDNFEVIISASSSSVRNQECLDIVRAFQSQTHLGVERDQFWRYAAQAHVALCTSKRENLGMGFLEQLYLRCALIIPETSETVEWTKWVFPDWYPWRYKSTEHAVQLLFKLRYTYRLKETQEMLDRCQQWLRETYGQEAVFRHFLTFLQEQTQRLEPPHEELFYTPPLRQLRWVIKAILFCRGQTVSIHTITRLIARYSKFYSADRIIRGRDRLILCDYDLAVILQQWGLVDDVSKAETTFAIPADWTPPPQLTERKKRDVAKKEA